MTPPVLLLVTGLPGTGKSSLAREAAAELHCAVLAHDWTMAGLRSQPHLWTFMEQLPHRDFRTVGWSVMWSLAHSELRDGRSVVLDGVARDEEVRATRDLARGVPARCVVVLTVLGDELIHRGRVEGRRREIPHWPELEWASVHHSREAFTPPVEVDLTLDAAGDFSANAAMLRAVVSGNASG